MIKAAWHDGNKWRGVFEVTQGFQNVWALKLHGKVYEFSSESPYQGIGKWNKGGRITFNKHELDECLTDLVKQQEAAKKAELDRAAFKLTVGYRLASMSSVDTEEGANQWHKLKPEQLEQIVKWLNDAGVKV